MSDKQSINYPLLADLRQLENIQAWFNKKSAIPFRYYRVLHCLDSDTEITLTELAKRRNITQQGCGKIVNHLVRDGLIDDNPSRGMDKPDNRERWLILSNKGVKALAKMEVLLHTTAKRCGYRFE